MPLKNTIRDGGSTALNTVYTVYTAYIFPTVCTVYTVYTVYTVKIVYNARTVSCMPMYIVNRQSAAGFRF